VRYRDVLVEGLRRAARRERLPLGPGDETALVAAWPDLRAFPEVPDLTGLPELLGRLLPAG
jgi:hypothetical protein